MHGLTLVTDAPPAGPGRTAELDGRRCRTRDEFFTAAADALSLPDWFGRNWDAFEESLGDAALDELRIVHAESLLDAEPPGALGTLVAILRARDPLPVTLVCAPDALPVVEQRLREAGSSVP